MYYVALCALSFCAAGFLFGLFRNSTTTVNWKWAHISGPAAIAVVFVVLGWNFAPAHAFGLVIRVEDENGQTLKSGSLQVDIGTDRRQLTIGGDGQAHLNETPTSFSDGHLRVTAEIPEYEPDFINPVSVPVDRVIYLKMKKKRHATPFSGTLYEKDGKTVLGHADVVVSLGGGDYHATSDTNGWFEMKNLPGAEGSHAQLSVRSGNRLRFEGPVMLNTNISINATQ